MKKMTKTLSVLFAAMVLFAGCSSDNDDNKMSSKLSNLKTVEFPEKPDQVLSRTATGNVVGGQKEYLQVVKRQTLLSTTGVFDGTNSDLIWPGSVLSGDAFVEGEYSPIVIKNAQPITISATLRGVDYKVSDTPLPLASSVRQSLNDLLYGKLQVPDANNVPMYLSYQSDEVTTSESFNKSFSLNVKLGILKNLVKVNFGYERSKSHTSKTHRVLVKVRQHFYSVSVDPKSADDWGELTGIQKYEPVYVSSVDYGRMVYLLVETEASTDSIAKTIKAGIELGLKKVNIGADTKYTTTLKNMFSRDQIKVVIAGGPLDEAKAVRDYKSLIEFLQIPAAKDLVRSAVPISYKVRSIRTNREVEVRAPYTEEEIILDK